MYRGVTAVFAGVVPAHSAYFSIYEVAKEKFGANKRGHHPMAAAASGAVATFSHDLVMTPLDVVKQRMQLGVYGSVSQAIRSMIKTEGVSSLFLSLPTTILMNIPAASINVAVNESCRRVLNPSGDFDMGTFFISGTIAGGIAGAVTNPLDVIKTRLQTQTLGCDGCGAIFQGGVETTATAAGLSSSAAVQKPILLSKHLLHTSTLASSSGTTKKTKMVETCARKYKGFVGTAKIIYTEEGLRGFARGTLSRAMTQAPAAAFSWSAYEAGKAFLNANYL
jgi:solute carrier family 25 iron transporter 28/37